MHIIALYSLLGHDKIMPSVYWLAAVRSHTWLTSAPERFKLGFRSVTWQLNKNENLTSRSKPVPKVVRMKSDVNWNILFRIRARVL